MPDEIEAIRQRRTERDHHGECSGVGHSHSHGFVEEECDCTLLGAHADIDRLLEIIAEKERLVACFNCAEKLTGKALDSGDVVLVQYDHAELVAIIAEKDAEIARLEDEVSVRRMLGSCF